MPPPSTQTDGLVTPAPSGSAHLTVDPDVRSGRVRIAGTRITVDDVVMMHLRLGLSLEQIVGKYQLDPAAVHAAMAYYYDHKDELDRRIAEDESYFDAFRRQNPSPLQDKLRALGRA